MSDRSEELHRKVWEVRKQMLLEELICQIGCTKNFSDWYDQAKRKGKSPEEWVAFFSGAMEKLLSDENGLYGCYRQYVKKLECPDRELLDIHFELIKRLVLNCCETILNKVYLDE